MNKVNRRHSQIITRQLQNNNKQHPRTFCNTRVSMSHDAISNSRTTFRGFFMSGKWQLFPLRVKLLTLSDKRENSGGARRAAAYKTNTITCAPYLFCVGRLRGAPSVCGEKPCRCCGNAGEPDNASCSYRSLSGSPGNRSMWLDARLRDCG